MITLEVSYKGRKQDNLTKKSLSKDRLDKYKKDIQKMVHNLNDLVFTWKL